MATKIPAAQARLFKNVFVCKRCSTKMRADARKIIEKRIKWHKDQVGKTVKYYQSLGKIKVIKGLFAFIRIIYFTCDKPSFTEIFAKHSFAEFYNSHPL